MEAVRSFLADYARRYEAHDGDAVAAACTVPLTISQGGRITCWTEAAPIVDNMVQLCAVYAAAGMKTATPELLHWQALGAHDGFALVRWTLARADGSLLQCFATAYQLQRQAGDWRIAYVVAFDENLNALRAA